MATMPKLCHQGHDDWYVYPDGHAWYCRSCRRLGTRPTWSRPDPDPVLAALWAEFCATIEDRIRAVRRDDLARRMAAARKRVA